VERAAGLGFDGLHQQTTSEQDVEPVAGPYVRDAQLRRPGEAPVQHQAAGHRQQAAGAEVRHDRGQALTHILGREDAWLPWRVEGSRDAFGMFEVGRSKRTRRDRNGLAADCAQQRESEGAVNAAGQQQCGSARGQLGREQRSKLAVEQVDRL
jgi:hypothetical protein